MFIAMATFGIIRGHILKEKVYKIGGLAFILMALATISISFIQVEYVMVHLVLGTGFFAAAFILIFANYSKFFEASLREVENASTKTVSSKPLRISDIFMWDGWFKIVKQWGVRKACLLYTLFNLCAGLLLPLAMWIFNIGNTSFVAFITIVMIAGVVILSIPAFYLQVVRNIETSTDDDNSESI